MPDINYSEQMPQLQKNNAQKEKGSHQISRYSLSGQLLETYANAKVAAAAMGTHQVFLSSAARKSSKLLTACGYLWRRGNAPEIDMKSLLQERWYRSSPLAKNQQTVGQYDLQGNLIRTFANTIEAAKAVGVHKNGIRDVIKGRGLTYGGFIWSNTLKKKVPVDPRITSRRERVSQYDLDGRWLGSHKNCYTASKATNIDNAQIHNVLNNLYLTAGGFLWRKGEQLRININELRKDPHYPGSLLEEHMKKKRKNKQ